MPILVERNIPQTRQTELGVHGWPTWKDAEGERTLSYDDAERSYFLAGRATLSIAGEAPVTVNAGDLVVIPAGQCRWQVHELVRRHYRSDALSPACCII
ncbi:MAG: cupin domain-containing protein [Pseudomonadota bacterium]